MSEATPVSSNAPAAMPDPQELLRSPAYLVLLIFGGLIGLPVALVAYYFLKLVEEGQQWVYSDLPDALGFDATPSWWAIPMVALAGVIVALAIDRLPGTAGEEPSEGFKSAGAPAAAKLPAIALAALATLILGGVLGPEAPLIAIGGGLGALILHLVKKDAPEQATVVIGAAGTFAAISTLLGSPLVGALLLMEVIGLGGPLLGVILIPGLLAAAIGSLVFLGLNSITGYGTFSLAVGGIPSFTQINGVLFLWAIVIGLCSAVLGSAVLLGAKALHGVVAQHRLVLTPLIGAVIGVIAMVFEHFTGHGIDQVLFSGQSAITPLLQNPAAWSTGALVAVMLAKSLAYSLSLGSLRGGAVFPSLFIGATVGMSLAHFSSLPMIAGAAMGIGAMAVTMLRLPLTSVLLTAVFLESDAMHLMPLIIVAVVVAYVASAHLQAPRGASAAATGAPGAPAAPPAPPAA